jgi:hypothetical protein
MPPVVDAVIVQRGACRLIRFQRGDQQSLGVVHRARGTVWYMGAGYHLAPNTYEKPISLLLRRKLAEAASAPAIGVARQPYGFSAWERSLPDRCHVVHFTDEIFRAIQGIAKHVAVM